MTRRSRCLLAAGLITGLALTAPGTGSSGGWTLIGWNNLGMHCMDSDFSVMSILPPYNTINAQLVSSSGTLVTAPGGITITYEAMADPAGSVNASSAGKTNFWDHALDLYGAAPPVDTGLAGKSMPGPANTPQPMDFDPVSGWWIAEGIPITPTDDASERNSYPMMHLVARDASGAVLATTDIVLPISDEMDCRACHASGSAPAAEPAAGWVGDPDPEIDYRLNLLLLHDDRDGGTTAYQQALATAGYSASGLYATAVSDGIPVLCARCHVSNALPGTGLAGISPLTRAMHGGHAGVDDPLSGMTLDASTNRSACYRCHPGSTTRCLRGAMGKALAADGTLAMQCQSCHGTMSAVGAAGREGWLEEPACGSCHTGTAVSNNGAIRYTSALEQGGAPRVPVDRTFATNLDTPAPGLSLYRFSKGHGDLQCSACHGSTHAESPSSHLNDNLQALAIQGHAGPLAECTACHLSDPVTVTGGPHGMHPIGQSWIQRHPDVAESSGSGPCRDCHGLDYRGTMLSHAQADRTLSTGFGTQSWWRGFQIGCYACHKGPNSESRNRNHPAVVSSATVSSTSSGSITIPLRATDADGDPLTLRIVSQPEHGTVGLAGFTATYFPESGYQGMDAFTFAAWDGSIDSNLGTITIGAGTSLCQLTCSADVPATADENAAVAFAATAATANCQGAPVFTWSFGDGQSASGANATHAYDHALSATWSLSVTADGQACTKSGTIDVLAVPPIVTSVKKLTGPFRIRIDGSNFHAGMEVAIDGTPWTSVVRKGPTRIILMKGASLKALFPKGVFVPIVLTNTDDQLSAGIEFRRAPTAWQPAP